jgi:predicted permease
VANPLLLLPDFLLIALGWALCRYTALHRPVWDGVERLVYNLPSRSCSSLRSS